MVNGAVRSAVGGGSAVGGRRSAVVVGLVARGRGRSFVVRRSSLGARFDSHTALQMTCGYTVISHTTLKGTHPDGMLASLPLAALD